MVFKVSKVRATPFEGQKSGTSAPRKKTSWLHAGVIHVAANMISLLFIGVSLEQEFGLLRIGLICAFSGFGGSLMFALAATGKNKLNYANKDDVEAEMRRLRQELKQTVVVE
ncbi:hypothetical protein COLO4_37395 [Corchorus olitorius]|uniref:RHOMBOID-like protein n=1 Tax=Corchorus olitorius TaxID=93759 RepID=A0A1R3G241_9ROSI|nr:hypothetical protein COLO4_37395 [Corchorus olitorius]